MNMSSYSIKAEYLAVLHVFVDLIVTFGGIQYDAFVVQRLSELVFLPNRELLLQVLISVFTFAPY